MLTGYLYHCIWFVIAHCYKYSCICVRIDKNWVRMEHEGSPFFNRKSDKVFLSDGWVFYFNYFWTLVCIDLARMILS